ncbi:MAG: NUDIX hydrolase [Acidimicrobiales bacterium]
MTIGEHDVTGLRIREAVRAVVIDPDGRVLLVRWEFPDRPALGYPAVSVWGTPGGGIEADEEVEPALRRELSEELGLDDPRIGPQIWERLHVIPFLDGRWDGQHDRFFLVESPAFEPAPRLSTALLRAELLTHIRWWTQAELATFVPTDTELFAPRRLPGLVASLLSDGAPTNPIDTGV